MMVSPLDLCSSTVDLGCHWALSPLRFATSQVGEDVRQTRIPWPRTLGRVFSQSSSQTPDGSARGMRKLMQMRPLEVDQLTNQIHGVFMFLFQICFAPVRWIVRFFHCITGLVLRHNVSQRGFRWIRKSCVEFHFTRLYDNQVFCFGPVSSRSNSSNSFWILLIFIMHHSISYRIIMFSYLISFHFFFSISIKYFFIFAAMKPRSISSQTSCSRVVEAFAKSRWLRFLHLSHMENARTLENPFIVDAPETIQF